MGFLSLCQRVLGTSLDLGLVVNSVAVRRKAKQEVGAITKLRHAETGKELTINVEYNQLDALLGEGVEKATLMIPARATRPTQATSTSWCSA